MDAFAVADFVAGEVQDAVREFLPPLIEGRADELEHEAGVFHGDGRLLVCEECHDGAVDAGLRDK